MKLMRVSFLPTHSILPFSFSAPKSFFINCSNAGTGSYACLKVDELPVNEVFVGIDNDFSDTNHYLELGGQLAATFHSKQ